MSSGLPVLLALLDIEEVVATPDALEAVGETPDVTASGVSDAETDAVDALAETPDVTPVPETAGFPDPVDALGEVPETVLSVDATAEAEVEVYGDVPDQTISTHSTAIPDMPVGRAVVHDPEFLISDSALPDPVIALGQIPDDLRVIAEIVPDPDPVDAEGEIPEPAFGLTDTVSPDSVDGYAEVPDATLERSATAEADLHEAQALTPFGIPRVNGTGTGSAAMGELYAFDADVKVSFITRPDGVVVLGVVHDDDVLSISPKATPEAVYVLAETTFPIPIFGGPGPWNDFVGFPERVRFIRVVGPDTEITPEGARRYGRVVVHQT